MLAKAPIVQPPDWSLPFHMFVDAFDVALGAVLMEAKVKKWYRPVYYTNKRLSPVERNYSVIKR